MSAALQHYRITVSEGDGPRLECDRCEWNWESDILWKLDAAVQIAQQHETDAHPDILRIDPSRPALDANLRAH